MVNIRSILITTDEIKAGHSLKTISDLEHIGVEKQSMPTGDDEKLRIYLQENCRWVNNMHSFFLTKILQKSLKLDVKKRPKQK